MSSNEKMKYIEEGSGDGLPGNNTETLPKCAGVKMGKPKLSLSWNY